MIRIWALGFGLGYRRQLGPLGAKELSKVRVRLDLISLCWVVLHNIAFGF